MCGWVWVWVGAGVDGCVWVGVVWVGVSGVCGWGVCGWVQVWMGVGGCRCAILKTELTTTHIHTLTHSHTHHVS